MTTQNMTNNYAAGTATIQVVGVSGAGSSTASVTPVDITSATVTITPTSVANKIIIYASFSCAIPGKAATNTYMFIQCLRDAVNINGTPYAKVGCDTPGGNAVWHGTIGFVFVDDPATVAATTYKFQQYSSDAAVTVTTSNVNITVMEVIA